MIGGEPYTLGLFDTAGENLMSFTMFWSVTITLGGCLFLDIWETRILANHLPFVNSRIEYYDGRCLTKKQSQTWNSK